MVVEVAVGEHPHLGGVRDEGLAHRVPDEVFLVADLFLKLVDEGCDVLLVRRIVVVDGSGQDDLLLRIEDRHGCASAQSQEQDCEGIQGVHRRPCLARLFLE